MATTNSTLSYFICFRSGFANQIREGYGINQETQEILYTLYEISSVLIVAIEEAEKSNWKVQDVVALKLAKIKLNALVNSQVFKDYDEMSKIGACHIVSSGTKQHIRAMFGAFKDLIGNK